MITVENMSYGFPEKDLYDKISFRIERGRQHALIGSNGTGKTTLADLLIHTDDYLYEGKIKKEISGRVAFVAQFTDHGQEKSLSVYDYLAADFLGLLDKQEALGMAMAEADADPDLYDRFQQITDEIDAVDAYNYDTNIHLRLREAGLTGLIDADITQLSGGEYKLLQIIRQMLRLPELLVMDEPDAFLDFDNLIGLSVLIKNYKGTSLTITHNRYLLTHCFNRILHLENKDLQEYDGNYLMYRLELLRTKIDIQERAAADAEEIARQQALVEKLREAATKSNSSSRGKTLKARVSYLGRLEDRQIKAPFTQIRSPKISLPKLSHEEIPGTEGRDRETMLRVEDLEIAFDETLICNVTFELSPGEKVAIVGGNGTGKTTLLRQIMEGVEGVVFDDRERSGFLSQWFGEDVKGNLTIDEVLASAGLEQKEERAKLLEDYCFQEGSGSRIVSTLSGGEKNLLQLAVLSKGDASLLLLDEPTSHLDLHSQISLEQALSAYEGAVLMVSHDFNLITECTDYILYIEDGQLRRMSSRAFRKMIYKKHFSKDYIESDRQIKQLELKVEKLLEKSDFEKAGLVCDELEKVIRAAL